MKLRFWKKTQLPPLDLTEYQGNWVAVKNNKLVAHAPTANELMEILTSHPSFRGCEAWFEELPEKVMRWAVKFPSDPGRVLPNDMFTTQEAAERWNNSWAAAGKARGTIWTRDGQHEPWRLAENQDPENPVEERYWESDR